METLSFCLAKSAEAHLQHLTWLPTFPATACSHTSTRHTNQPAWTSSLSQALPKPGALPKVSWPWSSPSSLSDSNRGEGGAPRRTIRDGDRRARMPNTLTANVVKGNYTGPGDLLAKWRHCISSVFQFMYSLRLVCFIFPHSHPKDFWIACCHDRCGLRI